MRFGAIFISIALVAACGSDGGDDDQKKSDAGADAAKDGGKDAKADQQASDAASDTSDAAPPQKFIAPKTGLDPSEVGVLVNEDDPQSVEVADYFVAQRQIPAANVVKLKLATGDVLSESDFATAKTAVDAALPATVQALVVTWTTPYRVDCMSVTSAFALGFDKKHCNTTGGSCGSTAAVDSFDSETLAPFTDFGIRPTMMIAGASAAEAKKVVDRGIAADATFPTGDGYLIRTNDSARSVRYPQFVSLTQQWTHPEVMKLTYIDNSAGAAGSNVIQNKSDVLFYFTGLADVPDIATNTYRPGAIADHLTSFGGQVPTSGQMSVVEWLEAGVTASFGTVVEPCNYTTKFPDPRVVLKNYYRGATLLEAYWKSVYTPGEGLFVGEPLARPWGTQSATFDGGKLIVKTTILDPAKSYAIESASSESGPFTKVKGGIAIQYEQLAEIIVDGADALVYRLVIE